VLDQTSVHGYALSPEQGRVQELLDAGSPASAYGVVGVFAIDGPFDDSKLEAALETIVGRHEILRTAFVKPATMTRPLQVVQGASRLGLERHDLQHLPDGKKSEVLATLAADARRKPFDLSCAPSLRVALARLAPDRAEMIVALPPCSADLTTLAGLLDELAGAYGAPVGKREADSDPVQYADYCAWLEETAKSAEARDGRPAWQHEFAESQAKMPFPFRPIRPPDGAAPTVEAAVVVPEALVAALSARASELQLGVCELLEACWLAWWSRVGGAGAAAIGVEIDGRKYDELAGAFGPFGTTVPLRPDVTAERSLADIAASLASAKRTATGRLESYRDPGASFWTDGAHSFIPVVSCIPHACVRETGSIRLSVTDFWYRRHASPLALTAVVAQDRVLMRLSADSRIISSQALGRIAGQYRCFLEAMGKTPASPAADIAIVQPEEPTASGPISVGRLLFDEDLILPRYVAEAARRRPDAPALVWGPHVVSYAVMNARANQLAAFVQEQGVGPDKLVGICLDRSPELVIAILGILKSGGAYVPLDPDTLNPGREGFPVERLLFMLRDTGIEILITQADLAAQIPGNSCKTVVVDRRWDTFSGYSDREPTCAATGRNLMYAIYTSGSTGRPKAVMVEHRSAINLLHGLRETIYNNAAPGSLRLTLNAPIGFDPSVQQLLMLADGHCLHIVPDYIRSNGRSLLSFLYRERIDALDCTPPQLRLLIAEGLLDGDGPTRILCGGEAIDPDTWRALANAPRVAAYNLYGPTECTVDATVAKIIDANCAPHIGRPLRNVDIYLLDEKRRPVPMGCIGEVFIGGHGVARGYLNRPELNAERFVANPLVVASAPLYRTGDLARQREDGCLEFVSRIDRQVKVRSHRIELGEIESLLCAYDGVASAILVVQDAGPDDKRLVAYAQPRPQAQLNVSALRSHLKAWVPEYMLPTHFVVVDAFPLTSNGKIDRARLPSPDNKRPRLDGNIVLPRTPLETRIAAVWSEILGIDEIGVNDTFQDLGGHSLLAVRLFERMERVVGVELPAEIFFGHQTVARHAEALSTLVAEAS
jgi:amino acid adenylation domain-containing protein